jgi:acyl-CoA thioesterase I
MKKLLMGLLMLLSGQGICQDGIRVACVGNSITEGPGRNHPQSYPLQLQSILGEEFTVKNFGVSGSTLLKTGDKPYWEEKQFEAAKSFNAEVLILKLGTNDTKPQNWKHKDDFIRDYVELIEAFKPTMGDSPVIFICLPVPIFQDSWGITAAILNHEIIPSLREIAKKTDAAIIDLNAAFGGKSTLFPDGIHPNAEGNKVMAETVAVHVRNRKP